MLPSRERSRRAGEAPRRRWHLEDGGRRKGHCRNGAWHEQSPEVRMPCVPVRGETVAQSAGRRWEVSSGGPYRLSGVRSEDSG